MEDFNHRLCVKIIMYYSKVKNISDKSNIAKILFIDNTQPYIKLNILANLRKTISDYQDIEIYKDYFDIPKLFIYIFLRYAFDLTDTNKLALKKNIKNKNDLYTLFCYENIEYEHSFRCQFDILKKDVDEFDLSHIFEYPKVQTLLCKNNKLIDYSLMD